MEEVEECGVVDAGVVAEDVAAEDEAVVGEACEDDFRGPTCGLEMKSTGLVLFGYFRAGASKCKRTTVLMCVGTGAGEAS